MGPGMHSLIEGEGVVVDYSCPPDPSGGSVLAAARALIVIRCQSLRRRPDGEGLRKYSINKNEQSRRPMSRRDGAMCYRQVLICTSELPPDVKRGG